MGKQAFFLSVDMPIEHQYEKELQDTLGLEKVWRNRAEFLILSRQSITIGRRWIQFHVVSMLPLLKGKNKRLAKYALFCIHQPYTDLRLYEQQLRYFIKRLLPVKLCFCLDKAIDVPRDISHLISQYCL